MSRRPAVWFALFAMCASACTHGPAKRQVSERVSPVMIYEPMETSDPWKPILGPIAAYSIDFPMPHMSLLSGWGSMQRGINMWVVSGSASLEQFHNHSIAVGEVCSLAANGEDDSRVHDLEHCYWDNGSRGTYLVLGQSGTVARLRRSDGRRFAYDMRTGRLSPNTQ